MNDERKTLWEGMDTRRAKTRLSIEGIDPATIIYPEGGWRVQDVIAHIAMWEEELALSVEAFLNGAEYQLTNAQPGDDVDDYNNRRYEEMKDMGVDDVIAMWSNCRERAKAALERLSDEQFASGIPCAWGFLNGVQLVKGMGLHEKGHINDILTVVRQN